MNLIVIIILIVNFIFIFLAFTIIVSDILKVALKRTEEDTKEALGKQKSLNKRGYLFGILALLAMVFLSLNYIG